MCILLCTRSLRPPPHEVGDCIDRAHRMTRMPTSLVLLCVLLPTAAGLRAAGLARPSLAAAAAPRAACAVMAPKPTPKEVKLDPAREKLVKGGLPVKFAERVSFQSSGQRIAGQEEMILTLWKEFKKCYPSEAVAQQMLSKNTAVILPQLNSPAKIKGTYALLIKRLGKKQAQEIITKNPGVLVCSPTALAKESDESIIKAANFVESVENNKPLISAASGLVFASIIGAFAYRIGSVGACPPGTC